MEFDRCGIASVSQTAELSVRHNMRRFGSYFAEWALKSANEDMQMCRS